MDVSVQDQIKLKFRSGAVCPHCGSKDVNKYGFFSGKQRYRCKECKRTFNLYTKTLLSWSHYKDKWESFIGTMVKDLSLRKAGKEVGVSYVTLFYWRHKIMTLLNMDEFDMLHGTLELGQVKLKYLNKFRSKKEYDEDEGGAENITFIFLYQRDNRLDSYIYKESTGTRSFIYELSENISKRSMVCLSSNYPFRYPLLYKKVRLADKKNYRRVNYFNADSVKKYLRNFLFWLKMFHGVSSKNLNKYAAFYRNNKIFSNMESIILSSIGATENPTNHYSACGALGF